MTDLSGDDSEDKTWKACLIMTIEEKDWELPNGGFVGWKGI